MTAPLRQRVGRYYRKLALEARKGLKAAARYEKKNELDRAEDIYREVSRSFSRMKKVKAKADEALERVSRKKRELASRRA